MWGAEESRRWAGDSSLHLCDCQASVGLERQGSGQAQPVEVGR